MAVHGGGACPVAICGETEETIAIGVLGKHPTVNSRRSNVNFDAIRGFFLFLQFHLAC